MRQLSTTFLFIFIFTVLIPVPVNAAVKGGIQYSLPVYYDNVSEEEVKINADRYFFLANQNADDIVNSDTTNALFLYNVLQHKNPENALYSIRLGILYDKIGKDRFAKGNFSRAISIEPTNSSAYYYLGEYYYNRKLYRKALKYYEYALKYANKEDYNLYYKLADIYEKFGDTRKALNFLEKASLINYNDELNKKINRIKSVDSVNLQYYKN